MEQIIKEYILELEGDQNCQIERACNIPFRMIKKIFRKFLMKFHNTKNKSKI